MRQSNKGKMRLCLESSERLSRRKGAQTVAAGLERVARYFIKAAVRDTRCRRQTHARRQHAACWQTQ